VIHELLPAQDDGPELDPEANHLRFVGDPVGG
jgi:hypothetical protein